MADFDVAIDQFINRAKRKIDGLIPAIGLEALAVLKSKTPVDTGNLRASWFMRIEGPATVKIATNVVYARRVEFGFVGEDSLGRTFNQKGAGMVSQTIAELPTIAKSVVERLQ